MKKLKTFISNNWIIWCVIGIIPLATIFSDISVIIRLVLLGIQILGLILSIFALIIVNKES